jgi:cysteine synthase
MGNILGKGSDVNENAVSAMEDVAEESIEQLQDAEGEQYDYLLSAVGNGTNTLGVGRKMKEVSPEVKFIGYEMMSSGLAFGLKYPGKYEEVFDSNKTGNVKPENFSRHTMPGTTFPTAINFPALKRGVEILDDVVLIADSKTLSEYYDLVENKNDPVGVVRYDTEGLNDSVKNFGRTTKAGINIALEFSKKEQDKNFLVIAYDRADRYDR